MKYGEAVVTVIDGPTISVMQENVSCTMMLPQGAEVDTVGIVGPRGLSGTATSAVSKTITWSDGRVSAIVDELGTKDFAYDETARLVSIAGMGVYPELKEFSYNMDGQLTVVTVTK